MEKRLFIVSNRLPVNIETSTEGNTVNISSGGLVSAISSYMDKENGSKQTYDKRYWIGVPGCSAGVWSGLRDKIPSEDYEYLPVFVGKKTYDSYYNGMSNSVLWALFHYFPSFAEFNNNNYNQYKQVNAEFLNVLLRHLQPNDVVWIHDYHLLPLAGMLRELMPEITIGFFLHIPFPAYEVFRIMPGRWQRELLEGMLGADLIGFHTTDYALHFLQSVQMILGIDHDMYLLRHKNRLVKVGVFPISIDFKKFHNAYDSYLVQEQRSLMRAQFQNRQIIFSVDRLDYTKGVSHRLRAYELFLDNHPEYHEKVVFVIVVVPSRDSITKYAERKRMIDEYISNLNSRIGNLRWQPVIYQYNSLSFDELIAMYTSCDLALITPVRDGMNLVAKEFVASRKDYRGVLILSEMTGAARELTEALMISPNDTEEMADKILEGLQMPLLEQGKRIRAMQEKIKRYDVVTWAADFFEQLYQARQKRNYYEVRYISQDDKTELMSRYERAGKRLFLLDYDGTLAPLAPLPHLASPQEELLDILAELSADNRNDVYIVSGRDSYTLNDWLGHLPLHLIAEHGALYRSLPNKAEWQTLDDVENRWMDQIEKLMEKYVRNCSGSFIERKSYSLAWHYRSAAASQSMLYASELYNELQACSGSHDVQVLKGNKVIEVRNKGINKGTAVKRVLQHNKYDLIFACGDDTTDEDMFSQLADVEQAYTVKVGSQVSYARYNVHTPDMVLSLLRTFGGIKGYIVQ